MAGGKRPNAGRKISKLQPTMREAAFLLAALYYRPPTAAGPVLGVLAMADILRTIANTNPDLLEMFGMTKAGVLRLADRVKRLSPRTAERDLFFALRSHALGVREAIDQNRIDLGLG